MGYTTTQLLTSIKRGVTMPNYQNRFTDPDLLSFADEEIEAVILPELLGIRQDFLIKSVDVPLVDGVANYKIPYRAVGRKLSDLKLFTSDGTFVRDLPISDAKDKTFYLTGSGDPRAFIIEGENVVLLPTPTSDDFTLKMYYELAPSSLVSTEEAGVITAIDTVTGIITISTAVAGFATNQVMDLIDGKSGNSVKAEDITNTNVASNLITFTPADLPDTLEVGDYVALSAETPVVQLPKELVQSLVAAVICRCLESQGDIEALDRAVARLNKKLSAAMMLLTPRVENVPAVLINRRGLLSQRPFNYRYRLTT
jgi:hypothetical protein